ncbi:MAG: hypothetical protein E3J86_04030, partial [Candidatus Thorarchaeota archaeon]
MNQESTKSLPYSSSGKTEKLVRNAHVALGIAAMLIQFPLLEFEVWFDTTGFALPVFIITIGIVYGFIPSRESDEDYLRHVVEPRAEEVSEETRARFLQFRKTSRRVVLLSGYVYAVIFQLIWMALANIGDFAVPALFFVFPIFASLVALGPTPFLMG